MDRQKKKPTSGVRLDLTKLDGRIPETRISVSDILLHGTDSEIRQQLDFIAGMIEYGRHPLKEPYNGYLVEALRKINTGMDANEALGLGRKGMSPQTIKNLDWLASNLGEQRIGRRKFGKGNAWAFLARFDWSRHKLHAGTLEGAGETLSKAVYSAYAKIFGKKSRKKD